MASASLNRGVGGGKGYSGNTCLTWKRRARSEQVKAGLGDNLENPGKRKTGAYGEEGVGVGKKFRNQPIKTVAKGISWKMGSGGADENFEGSGMAVTGLQPRQPA